MANPNPQSWPRLNIWAMLKDMLLNSAPILINAGVPSAGTSGFGAKKAGIGALCIDVTNGNLYINTGTKTSPVWSVLQNSGNNGIFFKRVRVSTTNANLGTFVVVAAPGANKALRLIDCIMIAIGGNAATATSVRLTATQAAGAVHLVVNAIANLTQSTPLRVTTAAQVIADGASFVACDANTAWLSTVNNNNLATATNIDYLLTYAIDNV